MRKLLVIVLVAGVAVAVLDAGVASAGLNVCVKKNGQIRAAGSASDCGKNETANELATADEVAAVTARVEALETLLAGVSREQDALLLSGLNLQVVNGTGSTDSENGLGNVIIGYNAASDELDRGGSHNLVVGDEHTFTANSGIVSGFGNTLSGSLAFVGGGSGNTASGVNSFVGGGIRNTASIAGAFVGGGLENTASGDNSFVAGGARSTASGDFAFAGGGVDLVASSDHAFAGGGDMNTASGTDAFVGGGLDNTASGSQSFVGGGAADDASATCAWLADLNVVPC